MTRWQAFERTRAALRRMTEEHGVPNSFSYGELAHYSGVAPMLAGRAIAHYWDSDLGFTFADGTAVEASVVGRSIEVKKSTQGE